MTIPILEIPEEIASVCDAYRPIFSKPQFKHFERFLTGLVISDEANIEALAEGFQLSQSYDALHHFVSEPAWDINHVLDHSVSLIKSLPDGQRFHEKGMLIIDDTLIEKFGKLMEGAGKLYDHAKGGYLEYAHCLVGLCWADHKKLRYPLRFELYRKEEDCETSGETFQTKIEIAIALVDWAIAQGIPFQTVVFDSWFFSKDLVDHIESLKKDWISMSKTNRIIIHKGKKMTCIEYAETLDPQTLPTTKINDTIYSIQSIQVRMQSLKREKETVRLLVSFEQKEDGSYKTPVFLVSNRKDIRPERLIQAYRVRWNIETFFKDAKSHLGLGEYQMRKLSGIKSHWCLVFTSAVLLELVRWNACTTQGLNTPRLSIGELTQRAFGHTLRSIITQVLAYGKAGFTNEQVYALLGI